MDTLGPYILGERLGAGGMGEVRAATHARWGHHLAVKLGRSALADSAAARAFEDEIRAVAALDHPHVVRIYDQGVADGLPWLAMERAVGTLQVPRDWGTLRRALLEVLDALAAAHACGLLHLDVKPTNVLVRHDGSHALADFGIVVARGALGRDLASLGWGSPPYMAPERFDCRPERLVEATDLYAVGCLAHHLASGSPPFAGTTWAEAADAHRAEPPPPLVAWVPVPPGFAEWVRTLLAKRPGERFGTAADARHALASLGEPVGEGAPAPCSPVGPTLTTRPLGEVVPLDELLVGARRPLVAPFPERWELPRRPRRLESVGFGLLGLLAVPFVGREEARATLWEALRAEGAGLVVIGGPRGAGRSRLAEEFARAAARTGAVVVRVAGRGASPLVTALRQVTGSADLEPERAREAVALRVGRPVDDPDVERIAKGSLATFARVVAGQRRVVVVVDDADALPVDELRDAGALVVATVSHGAEDLARRLGGRHVALAPLDAPTARELLADWVGLGPELVADLAERSEGDVGLALEMVRDGVRTGRLVQGPRGLEAVDDLPLPLPQAAIEAWRAELPEAGPLWPALERAAVYGVVVDRQRLARAVGDAAQVAELEQLVLARGLGASAPEGWRWASPALRACILTGAEQRLAEHHLACAAAMDEGWDRGRHLLDAGRLAEALPDLLDAANDVDAVGGMAVAHRRLRQLQAAMEQGGVPDSDPAWGALWHSFALLGPTHVGYATVREYYLRTVTLARRYPRDPRWRKLWSAGAGGLGWLANVQLLPKEAKRWIDEEGQLLREDGRKGAFYEDRIGWYALTVGDPDLAVRSFTEAVRVGTEVGNRQIRYVADAAIGVAKRHRGDPDAVEHLERAGAAMLEAGYLSARADLAAALGDAERQRGNLAKAEEHFQEALRATAEGNARADPGFRVGYAMVLWELGRLDRARSELDTARRTLGDEGPTWTALLDLHLAAVSAAMGDAGVWERVPAAVDALIETGFVDRDLATSAEFLAERAAADGRQALAAKLGHFAGEQRRVLARSAPTGT